MVNARRHFCWPPSTLESPRHQLETKSPMSCSTLSTETALPLNTTSLWSSQISYNSVRILPLSASSDVTATVRIFYSHISCLIGHLKKRERSILPPPLHMLHTLRRYVTANTPSRELSLPANTCHSSVPEESPKADDCRILLALSVSDLRQTPQTVSLPTPRHLVSRSQISDLIGTPACSGCSPSSSPTGPPT